jgi:hypothetical protein
MPTSSEPATLHKSPLRKRLERHSTLFVGLLAAFVIVIVVKRPFVPGSVATRKPQVGFFVTHGGTTSAGRAGDAVKPGDAVQFVYTAQAPSFLTILSADAGGHVEIRYPGGPQAARAPAGRDVVLPGSAVLNDIIGRESVLALFCAEPVEIEPVRRGWQATSGVGDPPIPAGCHADFTAWEKRAF